MFTKILDFKIFNKDKNALMNYIEDFEKVNIISGNPEILFNGLNNPMLKENFNAKSSIIIPDGVETIIDYAVFPSQVARSIPKMYIPSSLTNISDMNLKLLNNYGAIRKFEIAEDNPAFTLDSNGKIVRK